MKRLLIAACAAAIVTVAPAAWSSPGSTGSLSLSSLMGSMSIFKQLGGMQKISSLASDFVSSSLGDPRLAGLTAGKNVDPAATSGKVSSQLCAMLGGGCNAPLTNSQVASAASKLSPGQASAISRHFRSSLDGMVSNPAVRAAVMKELGSKLPGVLSGLL